MITSPNTSLEPTPVTPVSFRCGFRVGGSRGRRGSVLGLGDMHAHRSFRLTRSDAKDDGQSVGLLFSLVQQLVVLGIASLILDGGMILQVFSYAALAYWVCVAIIMIRRRRQLTPIDRIVIRIGFLAACAISLVITGFIWHLRGV